MKHSYVGGVPMILSHKNNCLRCDCSSQLEYIDGNGHDMPLIMWCPICECQLIVDYILRDLDVYRTMNCNNCNNDIDLIWDDEKKYYIPPERCSSCWVTTDPPELI